jgi:hypothetical protein
MSLPDYLIECTKCSFSKILQREVPETWYALDGLTYKVRPEIGWCYDCCSVQWRVPGLSLLTLHENINLLKKGALQVDNTLLSLLFNYRNDRQTAYRIQEIKKRLLEYEQFHSLGFCYECESTHILELAYPLNTNVHIGCGGQLIEKKSEQVIHREVYEEYYEPVLKSRDIQKPQ